MDAFIKCFQSLATYGSFALCVTLINIGVKRSPEQSVRGKVTMDEESLAEATRQSQDEIDRYSGFETLGGLETELKRLKSRVVCPLVYPCFFQNNLIRPVSGVLLYGESGTGKTTIAKACSPVL